MPQSKAEAGDCVYAIGWLVAYVVGSLIVEAIFEVTNSLNRDQELKPAAITWFLALGGIMGIVTGGLVPERILPPPSHPGISTLITPAVLAALMWWVGKARRDFSSHLATWYGGASLGLGLAVGRIVGLAFVDAVRAA